MTISKSKHKVWSSYQAKVRQNRAKRIKQAVIEGIKITVGVCIGIAFIYIMFLDLLTIIN